MNPALEYAFFVKKPGQKMERRDWDALKYDWYGELQEMFEGNPSEFELMAWCIQFDTDPEIDPPGTEIRIYNDTGPGPRLARHLVASFDAEIAHNEGCYDAILEAVQIYEGAKPSEWFRQHLPAGMLLKFNRPKKGNKPK